MPAVDPRLILALVWIVACTLVEFWLLRNRNALSFPAIGWAILAATAIRLIPALLLPRGARYEMSVFQQAGELTLAHESVYLAQVAHPYLPLQIYVFAAAAWLTDNVALAFPFWAKLPSIAAEAAMTGMIYLGVRRLRTPNLALTASWLYAFNPIVILVAAYQGQYDAIPMLFMVISWYTFDFHRTRRGGILLSSLALGLSVLAKTFPLMLLPILLLRMKGLRQWLVAILAVVAVPLLAALFYEWLFPHSLYPMAQRVVRTGAIPGWWGYSAPLNAFVELTERGSDLYLLAVQVGRYLAPVAALAVIFWSRRSATLASLVLTILTFFTFMPNLGLQSLSWLISLGLLLGSTEMAVYTLGVLVYMLASYWGIHLTDGLFLLLPALYAATIIQLSSLPAWAAVVWWWWRELRRQSAAHWNEARA